MKIPELTGLSGITCNTGSMILSICLYVASFRPGALLAEGGNTGIESGILVATASTALLCMIILRDDFELFYHIKGLSSTTFLSVVSSTPGFRRLQLALVQSDPDRVAF